MHAMSFATHQRARQPVMPPASRVVETAGSYSDELFIAMLDAFRSHGGMARWSEFEASMSRRSDNGAQLAAHWLRTDAVFAVDWGGHAWVPLFQIAPALHIPRVDVQQIADVLRRSFDEWQITAWFARPNAALGGATPVDYLVTDCACVLDAARRTQPGSD